MVDWINSWVQQIIVAVVIATIIEMIIPDGKNKKYIKTVIGIYILFTVVYPVVGSWGETKIDIDDIMKQDIYAKLDYSDMTDKLEKSNKESTEIVYARTVEDELSEYLESNNYSATSVKAMLGTKQKDGYREVNRVEIILEKDNGEIENIKKIDINTRNMNVDGEEADTSEYDDLIEYIEANYGVSKEDIVIIEEG